MKDHSSKAETDTAVQILDLNLAADGWRLEVIGVPDFPDRPGLPLFTPTFHIRSPQGTVFSKTSGGGGNSWRFTYSKNALRFEFSGGKTGGLEQRDAGPNAKGTAHEIGPKADLYVSSNEALTSLSDDAKRHLREELIQFLGVFSRHIPRDARGEGITLVVDQSLGFQQQWRDKLDGLLSRAFSGLEPVTLVRVWH